MLSLQVHRSRGVFLPAADPPPTTTTTKAWEDCEQGRGRRGRILGGVARVVVITNRLFQVWRREEAEASDGDAKCSDV